MATPALDIPVFDADNHLYETRDSMTKFLPAVIETPIAVVR